ncbi:ABC transporter permease [Amylibacter sp. IMCC11727]|uniref:ABC transporter permease n=1 Tax=Amylibacter sp. IMCC11727 TaxID=3039851 RepID=UPI00244DE57C|nr:ABC transporter permease [Amylibacter sp. IMCC11727]WGI23561.1 ABC transporter permease [Amylibacter sp. IMCC11727]
MFKSSISRRRLANFRANRRAVWSLWLFSFLFVICLFAELVANDKPLLVSFKGELHTPAFKFYPETAFGGDFETEPQYPDPVVQCLIKTGGLEACFDEPEDMLEQIAAGEFDVSTEGYTNGWILWAPIPYSFNTINYDVLTAPSPPDSNHWLGTDDQTRDVLARIIYGFRISTVFALVVVFFSSIVGIVAGAIMGYFGGWVDIVFQRILEIWQSTPMLYVIIIMGAIFTLNFTILTALIILFSWMGLVGYVRAEFLRTRNFEYVRAARALGVPDWKIMFRHLLPNAMVATITVLPFLITGAIGGLTTLDFIGYGLPPSYPSLGELALQARNNLQSPWLAFSAFFSISIMLSLLVFIFEGVRDAFDPRKTFK